MTELRLLICVEFGGCHCGIGVVLLLFPPTFWEPTMEAKDVVETSAPRLRRIVRRRASDVAMKERKRKRGPP